MIAQDLYMQATLLNKKASAVRLNPFGYVCEFYFGEQGMKRKGFEHSLESILLFKSLPFPLFPFKIKTHKHTLHDMLLS